MKKIKKLKLEKEVIANLNTLEMNEIKGGNCSAVSEFYGALCRSDDRETSKYCDLYTYACYNTQTCQCHASQFC